MHKTELTGALKGGVTNLEEVWIGGGGTRREGPGGEVAGSVSGKRIRHGAKRGLGFSAVSISCPGAGNGWVGRGGAVGTGHAEQSMYWAEWASP